MFILSSSVKISPHEGETPVQTGESSKDRLQGDVEVPEYLSHILRSEFVSLNLTNIYNTRLQAQGIRRETASPKENRVY